MLDRDVMVTHFSNFSCLSKVFIHTKTFESCILKKIWMSADNLEIRIFRKVRYPFVSSMISLCIKNDAILYQVWCILYQVSRCIRYGVPLYQVRYSLHQVWFRTYPHFQVRCTFLSSRISPVTSSIIICIKYSIPFVSSMISIVSNTISLCIKYDIHFISKYCIQLSLIVSLVANMLQMIL